MATDYQVDKFIVNKLSKAQYDEQVSAGTADSSQLWVLNDWYDVLASEVQTALNEHENDAENPHQVTYDQIGAAPAFICSTTDLTAGTSALETGKVYLVYE